jgi:hypothetical protein
LTGHGGSTKRRRVFGAVIAAALLPGALFPIWASADYRRVEPGYTQWRWASGQQNEQIHGVAVRPDGHLIVSMMAHRGPPEGNLDYRLGDGYLHLIPPWGGRIDATNRFGPQLGLGEIVIRRGELYGFVRPVGGCDPPYDNTPMPTTLHAVNLESGAAREIAPWQACIATATAIAVDPRTGDLALLEDLDSTLVLFNPETKLKTPLFGGLQELRITSIGFSPDGNSVFVASHTEKATIRFSRNGSRVGRITTQEIPQGKYADGMIYGTRACFKGKLYLNQIPNRKPIVGPQTVQVAQTPEAANEQSVAIALEEFGVGDWKAAAPMTTDREGNMVVVQHHFVMVIGCRGVFRPPTKPAASPPRPVEAPVADPLPGAVGPRGSLLAPPGPGGAPALQNAPATQVQPGPQSAAQAGAQSAAAPNAVGLVDAPADEPAFRLAASPLGSGFVPLWARLAAGAMLIVAMGSAAVVLERSRRPRVARARANPWEGV